MSKPNHIDSNSHNFKRENGEKLKKYLSSFTYMIFDSTYDLNGTISINTGIETNKYLLQLCKDEKNKNGHEQMLDGLQICLSGMTLYYAPRAYVTNLSHEFDSI